MVEKKIKNEKRNDQVTPGVQLEGDPLIEFKIANTPIEEMIYWANLQRTTYGINHATASGKATHKWFKWFENGFGPDLSNNPLRYPQPEDDSRTINSMNEFQNELLKDRAEARRALRTAGWGMMFYLITTDVIGPFNAPYAIHTVGWVGGVLLYIVFGLAAYYGSFILLNLYLRLDSDRYPVRTYGEMMEVFYGRFGQYLVSGMQVVQIIFIVASNIIVNAQSMTQLTQPNSNGPLCFIVSIIIWTVIGLIISIPFRSLAKLSYIASFNVFINLLMIFLSMGFIAHSAPNYDSAAATYGFSADPPYAGPVMTSAVGDGDVTTQINGAMNMVFGWGGLMIFIEFMAEMRRPVDFVKSFTAAELLIGLIYIVYGCYVYGLQGQYTLPVAFQGVSSYTWQSIGNGLSLWTYNMASVTYLNIGVKVMYWFIFDELFKGPPLMSRMGFVYWSILQAIAWWISMLIGTAIPQVQTIQGLVAAVFLLQFSYTFPALLQLTYDINADASKEDEVFVPGQPPRRVDSWRTWSRWKRGLFTGRVYFKGFNLVYFLAGVATCGLGIYGSAESIKETFSTSAATSFGCSAPV